MIDISEARALASSLEFNDPIEVIWFSSNSRIVRRGHFIKLTRSNVLVEHPTSGRLFKAPICSIMSLRVIDVREMVSKAGGERKCRRSSA